MYMHLGTAMLLQATTAGSLPVQLTGTVTAIRGHSRAVRSFQQQVCNADLNYIARYAV